MSCYSDLLASLNKRGLKDRIPEERLQEMAEALDRFQAEGLSASEYRARVQESVKTLFVEYAEKRAIEERQRLSITAQALKAIQEEQTGRTRAQRLMDFFTGGSVKGGFGGNLRLDSMAETNASGLKNLWMQLVRPLAKDVRAGVMDKETFRALAIMERGGIGRPSDIPVAAWQYAEAIRLLQKQDFALRKAFTPYLEETENYLINRVHDRERIQSAGPEKWIPRAIDTFGKETFPEASPEQLQKIFEFLYKRITDGSYGSAADLEAAGRLLDPGREGSLMQRMARERTLQATDEAKIYEYNKDFGYGTIDEAMARSFQRTGKNVAVLQKYGPKPEEFFRGLMDAATEGASHEERGEIEKRRAEIYSAFRQSLSYGDAPARYAVGKFFQGLRSAAVLADLGLSVTRVFPSFANASFLARGLNGKSIPENALSLIGTFAKSFASSEERNKFLQEVRLSSKMFENTFKAEIGVNPGGISGVVHRTFDKLTMIHQLVDSARASLGMLISKDLGENSALPWEKLTGRYQKGLARYAIEKPEWELMRQSVQEVDKNGLKFSMVTPDSIEALPDEAVKNYLVQKGFAGVGEDIHPDFIRQTKYDLSTRLGTLINDHADYGSHTAGLPEKIFMYGGSSPDSPDGIARRLFWQFKSAILTNFRAYQRSFYSGEGARGDWSGLGQAVATGMFSWAVGEYAHQMANGKSPEDPRSLDFAFRAFVGSGAGSLVGTALFDVYKFGDEAGLAKLLGPVPGALGKAGYGAVGALIAKTPRARGQSEAKIVGGLQSFLPFQTAPIAGAVLHHYLIDGAKEFLDPGYLSHLQRGSTKDTGQVFLFNKPTEAWVWPRSLLSR